jgi:hypothetical protein
MKMILAVLSLMLAAVLPFEAYASELKPLQAGSFVLGNQAVPSTTPPPTTPTRSSRRSLPLQARRSASSVFYGQARRR